MLVKTGKGCDMKTMQEAAQMALTAQDACNLSGLVYSFAEMMKLICEEDRKHGHGTDWKNSHPICVLMTNKMADLARSDANFSRAYEAVKQMAAGEELAVEGGER
jgi:hypothetical protein